MSEDTIYNDDGLPISQVVKTQDETLKFLCQMANLDICASVTIFLKGTVITGNLISGANYFKKVAEKFKAIDNKEVADIFADFFSEAGVTHYSTGEGLDSPPTSYLHLSGAQIVNGNGHLFDLADSFLRVRLDEIDGHLIGKISLPKQ
ncbi:hypothetical protein [Serratia liquefaciens]|uniref:hypothetical protein n=1 Tax=Serratia liquefaciens TaxID=614 RepID=UPI00236053C8|nr:hypothetical protein [Serratia liquefaciens]